MGDRSGGGRTEYPVYADDFAKCREFLQTYSEGEDNFPYQIQLVRFLLKHLPCWSITMRLSATRSLTLAFLPRLYHA